MTDQSTVSGPAPSSASVAPPSEDAASPQTGGQSDSSQNTSSEAPRISLRSIADAPVDSDASDRLGFQALADALADLIRGEKTATPLTVAVSAPWGAGKTSLLNLVRNRLVNEARVMDSAPHIVLWFNAWMHDAAPNLSAALAADVSRGVTKLRGPWTRLAHPLPSSILSPEGRAKRKFVLALGALLPSIAVALLTWKPVVGHAPRTTAGVIGVATSYSAGWLAFLGVVYAIWSRVRSSVAAVASFIDDPKVAAANGSMPEVSEQLRVLIEQAREGERRRWLAPAKPRVVVIIDDLERCEPPKAVDVCQVAAQLLNHEGVITILVGDLRVIASSAEQKYGEAAARYKSDNDGTLEGWQGFGRSFLQKVVQFELELPPPNPERLRELAESPPVSAALLGGTFDLPRRPIRHRLLYPLTPLAAIARSPGQGPAFAAVYGVKVAVALGAMALLYYGVALRSTGLLVAGATTFASGFVLAVFEVWRRRRLRKRLVFEARLDALAEEVISQTIGRISAVSTANVEREVLSELQRRTQAREWVESRFWARAGSAIDEPAIQARLRRRIADDDGIRDEAESVIVQLLPPLPRTAKRMLNRLYFLLVVCSAKDILGGGGATPKQIGKWAVLLDRWPDLANTIIRNPGLMAGFEDLATTPAAFRARIDGLSKPLVGESTRLLEFFQAEPKIASVAAKLAFLDPNPPAAPNVSADRLTDALERSQREIGVVQDGRSNV